MLGIKAAHCFDGERFRDGGATVLFDGDRIVGVEPLAYDVPDGVDVTTYGGTLLPGLIDCHVHLVADGAIGSLERAGQMTDDELDAAIQSSLEAQVAGGVTTVRDLGDVRFRTLVARDRFEPGLPRVISAGPPLTIVGGHCHYLGGAVEGTDGVAAAVRDHVERGVDLLKVMASGGMLTVASDVLGTQFTHEELRAAVATAHEHGRRVVAHAHSEAGIRHAVAAGVDGLEHVTCMTAEGLSVPEDIFAQIAERGVTVDPTWGADPARMPPLHLMPPAVRELTERLRTTPIEVLLHGRIPQVSRLRELGVRVVCGLDAGAVPSKPHGALWRAVGQLTSAGFSPAEALQTATSVAADDCALGGTTGRLRPGLAADLLVVDGDLESDLTALSKPVGVWVRGTSLDLP